MQRFEGRVAIVAGGGAGIGLANAKRLASEGARVIIAGRDGDDFAAAAAGLNGNGDHIGLACDVSDERQVEACLASGDAAFVTGTVLEADGGRSGKL